MGFISGIVYSNENSDYPVPANTLSDRYHHRHTILDIISHSSPWLDFQVQSMNSSECAALNALSLRSETKGELWIGNNLNPNIGSTTALTRISIIHPVEPNKTTSRAYSHETKKKSGRFLREEGNGSAGGGGKKFSEYNQCRQVLLEGMNDGPFDSTAAVQAQKM